MSAVSVTLASKIEKICSELGLPLDVVLKVYCEGEEAAEEFQDKLVRLESIVAERLGVEKMNMAFRALCERYRGSTKEFTEHVIKVPVFLEGEQRYVNMVISDGKIRIDSDMENLCREPDDVLVGWVSLYVRCGSNWVALVHRLSPDVVVRLRKVISRDNE